MLISIYEGSEVLCMRELYRLFFSVCSSKVLHTYTALPLAQNA
jgi:hypothetical protein